MKNIAILGSTGSIGQSTLRVVETYPERFQLISIAAGSNVELAFEQTFRWRPKLVSLANEGDVVPFQSRLSANYREDERNRPNATCAAK